MQLINTEQNISNNVLAREESQSLQCLSNGCPSLKLTNLNKFKLSTSDINYLVNQSVHLVEVVLFSCNICDDGLIRSR